MRRASIREGQALLAAMLGCALLLARPAEAAGDSAPSTLSGSARPGKRAPPAIEGETKIDPKTGLELAWIPKGTLHQGCEPQDAQCFDDELHGHRVRLAGFWMGKTDVTVAAYKLCVDAGACKPAGTGEGCNGGTSKSDHPINCVDWSQARAFCAWFGGRLPSADEWEYAAKGGESRIYPWGDQVPSGALASSRIPWVGTEPVGSYPLGASKAGLLDMVGDVAQWTSSNYDAEHKEVRGSPDFFRITNRRKELPTTRHSAIGFRCAL